MCVLSSVPTESYTKSHADTKHCKYLHREVIQEALPAGGTL